jgi:hypothetical protein
MEKIGYMDKGECERVVQHVADLVEKALGREQFGISIYDADSEADSWYFQIRVKFIPRGGDAMRSKELGARMTKIRRAVNAAVAVLEKNGIPRLIAKDNNAIQSVVIETPKIVKDSPSLGGRVRRPANVYWDEEKPKEYYSKDYVLAVLQVDRHLTYDDLDEMGVKYTRRY